MSNYFSERERGPRPRTLEVVSQSAWSGLLALILRRVSDGSLGYEFSLKNAKRNAIIGTDEFLFWRSARGEIPHLALGHNASEGDRIEQWRPSEDPMPPANAIFDLVEFVARHIARPTVYDQAFGHDLLEFARLPGLRAWVEDVNHLLARNGLAFEMSPDGQINRLLPGPLHDVLATTEFATGDAEADSLLARAVALLTSRAPDAHQDALEKLWDAFERIKTLMPGDKRQSADALIAAAAADGVPRFNQAILDEFRSLTSLGNVLRIRHSETDKEPIASRQAAEYLFHRMFAVLRYVLFQTGRVRQG